jgi:hypothetical protein
MSKIYNIIKIENEFWMVLARVHPENISIVFNFVLQKTLLIVIFYNSEYLNTTKSIPWLLSIGKDFNHGNTKCPNIAGVRELAILKTFRSTPGM